MKNNDSGWIKLHRKIQKHWIWEDPEKLRAWIDILLMVNHEDRQVPLNGHIVTVKRGEKLTSISKLAKRWGWNRKRVVRFLGLLEEAEMCLTKRTTNGTTIKVLNYAVYQDFPSHEGTTKGTTTGSTVGSTVGTQTIMNKNYKNDKEEHRASARFVIPTIEEVSAFVFEHDLKVDPEEFVDFYQSRGWKHSKGLPMTDWEATLRSWDKRERSKQEQKPAKVKQFNNFEQRTTDWDEVERQMFRATK